MSLAPQEIEKSASKYASAAIKYDSQGARGMAITHYQKAIDTLFKLLHLYPDSKLNKIYRERMKSYQDRIKILQSTHGVDFEPAVDPKASPETQQANLAKTTEEIHLMIW
jgi:tetratricopeptide (TPR) repeat protein